MTTPRFPPTPLTPQVLARLEEQLAACDPADLFVELTLGDFAALVLAARKLAPVQAAARGITLKMDLEAILDDEASEVGATLDASPETLAALFTAALAAIDHPGVPEVTPA